MMLVGSTISVRTTMAVPGTCTFCSSIDTSQMIMMQWYAHFFWIPLFPMAKTCALRCTHCKQVLEKDEMPDDMLSTFTFLKSDTKTPLWMYSGVIALAVITVWSLYYNRKHDNRTESFIRHPLRGDVYDVSTKSWNYTLLKVEDLRGDSVYVRECRFIADRRSGLKELRRKGESAYFPESSALHKDELMQMLKDGHILDVTRDR